MAATLSEWIEEQLKRGCDPGDMITAMTTVGHDRAFAQDSIKKAVERLSQTGAIVRAKIPEPLDIGLADGESFVTADGRKVRILINMKMPRLIVFESVLSDEECDALIEESRPKLERSKTVNRESGGTELNDARTSEGTYFFHEESPLLVRINQRLSELTRWPLEHGEPLQILHYDIGARYEPHFDYFDPSDQGTGVLTSAGGQRVATLITYLNTPEAGGATVFPDLGLEVAPLKGNAVFFSYDRPHPDTLTLHGGTPVVKGEKWIATRWMRERPYR